MARALKRHQARNGAVSMLGRALSRRARSCCELCGDKDELRPVEVSPLPEEPNADHALLACGRCRLALSGGRGTPDPQSLRFLETAVWSQVPPAQVAAVRLADRLGSQNVVWARDLVDGLYLDPAVEAWVGAV
jgi:protein PhnA